jgi:hypothetical protein
MIVTREPRPRTYLMCAPEHFAVQYAINPWMDVDTPVDGELAGKQWDRLRETLIGLGHTIHTLEPLAGLPDMVYAANGAFSVDAVVYGARFRHPQRAAEAAAHRTFYEARSAGWRFVPPQRTNEGEGDFAYLPRAYGGLVLAGYGFPTPSHPRPSRCFGGSFPPRSSPTRRMPWRSGSTSSATVDTSYSTPVPPASPPSLPSTDSGRSASSWTNSRRAAAA